jgi:prepilin-type N-terminal cleavage/methylation domain-containing protein
MDKKRGFTLIELLVVISIIALLLAVTVMDYVRR